MDKVLVFCLFCVSFSDKEQRKQCRRLHIEDDQWASEEHQLFSHCSARAFSLSSQLQVGGVLHIQEPAVHATVRVHEARIIVQTIGPRCLATIWNAPAAPRYEWENIHQELTWVCNILYTLLGLHVVLM